MNTKDNNEYVSRQISVYKTDKKLVEFLDKLNTAPLETYAHIHAQANSDENGRRIYSNIGIVLQDYTNGTGSKTVRVTANISPDEAQYIFSRVQGGVEKFEFTAEKIFGEPDEEGLSKMTKVKIVRATVGSDGKVRNYPWNVDVENGRGKAAKGKAGGTYCQSKTYECGSKVFININDLDFFKLMNRVSQYINAWEVLSGFSIIGEGRTAIENAYKQAAN